MKDIALTLMFSISLKARILRVWQAANQAADQEYSERELLTLELIQDFGPITEKGICKVFGIGFSTASDLLDRLGTDGLLDEGELGRGKALQLTEEGRRRLDELKRLSATRFGYLFEGLSESDWESLTEIFKKADLNASTWVSRLVFGRVNAGAATILQNGRNM
jgi:DNA-binding MarR family transcriptional regulator